MATVELDITGMHCGSCSALIEESLAERSGVRAAAVDLQGARATVDYDPAAVGVADLCAVVADAGYQATAAGAQPPGP